jgi:thiol-disulfide isomerase/thioredoxin
MKQSAEGVVVERAWPGSPAALAGLKEGDRVLAISGQSVVHPSDVSLVISRLLPGQQISLQTLQGRTHRLLTAVLQSKPDPGELVRRALLGSRAPDLTGLQRISGKLSLGSGLLGSVLVIDFWATWCPACRLLSPALSEWHEALSPLGIAFVGVTMDAPEAALTLVQREELHYSQFVDPTGDVTRAYYATALPTLVVIDRAGVVREVMVGFYPQRLPQVRELIRQLALEPEPKETD